VITLEEALVTGRGTERPINCPNPDHPDDHASASLNVVKGVWFCYGCHTKGTVAGHIPDPKQALKLLAESDEEPRVYPWSWLDVFDAHHPSPYWAARFGEDTASTFRCGTDPVSGEPTYPLIDSIGDVLGVVRRSEGTPKYRYPYRARTSTCLFMSPWSSGLPEVLILLEGAADVMSLHSAGLPIGWRAAGCYGAGLHRPQMGLVTGMMPRLIVLAFDSDEAGKRAIEQAWEPCSAIAPTVSVAWSNFDVKDPAELPPPQRIQALHQAIDTVRSTA